MTSQSAKPGEQVSGLVLAAGGSRRFGCTNKLLADLAGKPLLELALKSMTNARIESVVCVLGADSAAILERVDLRGAIPLIIREWKEGQSASLRAGIDALASSDAIVVTLGDQPLVSSASIDKVVGERSADALATRAAYAGRPGHPVVLEKALFGDLLRRRGDAGARHVLAEVETKLVPCDDLGSDVDVDTADDLAAAASRLRTMEIH